MKSSLSALLAVAVAGLVGVVSCAEPERSATEPTPEVGCALIGMRVSPGSATLLPGDTLRIRATETPCSGITTAVVVRWKSSDTTVATVSSDGLVRARTIGVAAIIATAVADAADQSAMALSVGR